MKIRRRQLFFFLHFGQHQSPRITTLVSMQLRHPTFQMGASFEEALTGAESLGPVLLLKAVVNSVTFRSFYLNFPNEGNSRFMTKVYNLSQKRGLDQTRGNIWCRGGGRDHPGALRHARGCLPHARHQGQWLPDQG